MNSVIRAVTLVALVCSLVRTSLGADAAPAADQSKTIRIGAVAYSPSAVTIFDGLTRYLSKNGLPSDYVLYSSYDALVAALDKGEVDIGWNTPLAHAQYHVKNQC